MKNLKILIFLFFIIEINKISNAQIIDSVTANYNTTTQELTIFVEGQVIWGDPNAIVSIEDTLKLDSILIDIHFLPCQMFNMFLHYDTTIVINTPLTSGLKTIRIYTFLDEFLDSTSCYYNEPEYIVDTAYLTFNVPISIKENTLEVNIYPNPVTDKLFIKMLGDGKLEVFDLHGRMILYTKIIGRVELDLTELDPGVYFYKLENYIGVKTGKIIVN